MPVLGSTSASATSGIVSSPYEGLKPVFAGNSYANGGSAVNNFGHFQRLRTRLNLNPTQFLIAVGGQSCTASARSVLNSGNGILTVLQNVSSGPNDNSALFVDALVTEYLNYGNSPAAKAVAKSRNAIASMLAATRASSNIFNSAGTASYTGTWTAAADTEAPPNNTSTSTTTQNDSVTITGLTAGGRVAVMLLGIDNTADARTGAAFTISSGATTLTTGTTSNKHAASSDSLIRGLMPVMVTLPGGATTLTITKTDASGSVLYFAGLYPQVAYNAGHSHTLLVKALKIPGATTAGIANYNDALDLAVSDVTYGAGDPGILVFDPNTVAGFDFATMMDDAAVHPNDRGHALITDALVAYISAHATYGRSRNYQTA